MDNAEIYEKAKKASYEMACLFLKLEPKNRKVDIKDVCTFDGAQKFRLKAWQAISEQASVPIQDAIVLFQRVLNDACKHLDRLDGLYKSELGRKIQDELYMITSHYINKESYPEGLVKAVTPRGKRLMSQAHDTLVHMGCPSDDIAMYWRDAVNEAYCSKLYRSPERN